MSTSEKASLLPFSGEQQPGKKRVFAFIDGFNLYHAIERFDRGGTEADKQRYQGYKWLNLSSLLTQFVRDNEELVDPEKAAFRHLQTVFGGHAALVRPESSPIRAAGGAGNCAKKLSAASGSSSQRRSKWH